MRVRAAHLVAATLVGVWLALVLVLIGATLYGP